MPLLLTLLSVLLTLGFLSALVIALLLILKPLQGVRGSLEKIALGVRAIERQMEPLAGYGAAAGPALDGAREAMEGVRRRIEETDETIARAIERPGRGPEKGGTP